MREKKWKITPAPENESTQKSPAGVAGRQEISVALYDGRRRVTLESDCYLEIYDKGKSPLFLVGTGRHRSSAGSPILYLFL